MKCLHILPMNKLSGAEKLTLILCKNIQKYKPIVVCGGDNLKSIFEENYIKSYCIDFKNNSLLKTSKELNKIIKENNIKIVHAHDNSASINGYITKLRYRCKFKLISHIHSCYPWIKTNSINKIIDSFFRNRYDYNIACGKLVYDFYIENTNYINKEKISVLSNAVDINIEAINSNKNEEIKEKFKIPKNKIVLGYIGRLVELKGLVPFIKEFSKYKKEFSDSVILLVGSGEQELEIKDTIKELDLEDSFILTGHQENVQDIYPIIDVFLLPSTYEGLPMVILEAMSYKVPVVSMDVGSIKELVKNKSNGYLIDKCDYKSFVKALLELKSDRNKRDIYGKQALKDIQSGYSIQDYIKDIEKIYDNLI